MQCVKLNGKDNHKQWITWGSSHSACCWLKTHQRTQNLNSCLKVILPSAQPWWMHLTDMLSLEIRNGWKSGLLRHSKPPPPPLKKSKPKVYSIFVEMLWPTKLTSCSLACLTCLIIWHGVLLSLLSCPSSPLKTQSVKGLNWTAVQNHKNNWHCMKCLAAVLKGTHCN